jgi:hypothetical protein
VIASLGADEGGVALEEGANEPGRLFLSEAVVGFDCHLAGGSDEILVRLDQELRRDKGAVCARGAGIPRPERVLRARSLVMVADLPAPAAATAVAAATAAALGLGPGLVDGERSPTDFLAVRGLDSRSHIVSRDLDEREALVADDSDFGDRAE